LKVLISRGQEKEEEEEECVLPIGRGDAWSRLTSGFRQEEEGCSISTTSSRSLKDLQEWNISRRRRARVQE
jgi:hypothetical protein